MLTTIDVLSGGRLDIGIGAGWQKVEIDAVATTPFEERGAVTDEYIDAFRAVWTQTHVKFDGKYTRIDGLMVDPKPVQKPYPPIWVGGETGPSMRRAARVGDVWYPIGSNKANMLDTLPRLEAGIAKMRDLTAKAGREAAWAARAVGLGRQQEAVHRVDRQRDRGHRRAAPDRRHRDGLRLRGPRYGQGDRGHEKIP
jgi:alkanesulfonate monooxygenase SsuD/methylene tetrahydromethanopterin reductase-like flavin-dependent oxidoreductase (luciferase family)